MFAWSNAQNNTRLFLSNEVNESRLKIESFWRHANSSRSIREKKLHILNKSAKVDTNIFYKQKMHTDA